MGRGNKTNHPRTYAKEEDVREVRHQLHDFFHNEWPHYVRAIGKLEGEKLIVRVLLAAVLGGIGTLIAIALGAL